MTARIRLGLDYAVVFVAYVATARFGLSFDALAGIATTVWPPTGIALAALILRGTRLWPAVALAAFAVNVTTGIPVWGAAIIATGNTLEAVAGAAVLRRFSFDARLARLRDVLLLVVGAALASTLISAAFGVAAAALARLQRAESYPVFGAVWWMGDAMGDLLIAPLICVWASSARLSRRPLRWLEAMLLAAALSLVSIMVFRRPSGGIRAVELIRGTYAIVPLLIWVALRFEQRGTAAALLLVAVIAVTATSSSGSYFAARTPHERLLMTDCYMAVTAISMLTLVAALAERRAAIGIRDEFISIASHELKTPLTALKLRLTAATRTQQTPPPRERAAEEKLARALAAAATTTDRLATLVDDLLDVSRLTAGRLMLHLESVSLSELARDVAARLREQAAEAGSTIDVAVPEPIVGRWDRIRIEQVVTNLLSNAIKYGLGRPILLSAQVVNGWVRLDVKDAGLGISRADQSRIFQAFERVTTAGRVGGLGLGLYIGRQIALAHGGALSVDSRPDLGSTFTLELPLEVSASGATSPTPPAS
jgi:signal transduction histidine kinase